MRGREPAGHVDMVVAQRKDGVQPFGLAVAQKLNLKGVLACGCDDLECLVVQLLLGRGEGVEQSGELVHPLVFVLHMVKKVLRLLLRMPQLVGDNRVIVSLAHGSALLLDNLHVDFGAAAAKEADCSRLIHRLCEPCGVQRDGKRNDVGQRLIGKLRAEMAHREHLAPHAVRLKAVDVPFRLEIEAVRRDGILRRHPGIAADVLAIIEVERLHRAQLRVDHLQTLGSVENTGRRVHGREDSLGLRLDAGKLRQCLVDVLSLHREGDVTVAPDVRYALAELLVQNLVEQRRILGCVRRVLLHRVEELAASDLGRGNRRVDDAHLNQGVCAELVVKAAHG